MNGRALSEEEMQELEKVQKVLGKNSPDYVNDLIATIRDRDKTIAEKEESRQSWRAVAQFRNERIQVLSQQNTLMLEALKEIKVSNTWREAFVVARNTVAKVKALRVSKRGEILDTSVASEQT